MNETHDATLISWVASAQAEGSDNLAAQAATAAGDFT